MRAEQGAGPVTLGIDIGVIKMIITHAAAVHGPDISPEPVDLARVALMRLGLIGRPPESVFDFVQGITAVARSKPQQDTRLAMEGKAQVLLDRVA
jgi:hypothetical protein